MCVEIRLANSGLVALIDKEDEEKVAKYKWNADTKSKSPYAFRGYGSHKLPKKYMLMHRYILDAPQGVLVDHINGNGLDNRRANLRFCSHAENIRNRVTLYSTNKSGVNGVYWCKTCEKWMANISVDGKLKTLGRFTTLTEAASVRRSAELKYYGDFAPKSKEIPEWVKQR